MVRRTFRDLYALSFYAIKTVLVGPKLFWSNQIDLDLTIMIWSRPNWNGHDQNEGPNVFHFGRKSQFGPDQFILVVTISFWSRPNHYGQVQINLVRPKPFWTNQNCFGHIEGQGISIYSTLATQLLPELVSRVKCNDAWIYGTLPKLRIMDRIEAKESGEILYEIVSRNRRKTSWKLSFYFG